MKRRSFDVAEPLFWYLVGLVATDGCLSSDGRHVDVTAKDKNFLEQLRQLLDLRCGVSVKNNGRGQDAHRIQIGSRSLYDRLLTIGLTPRKSLTLGPLKVPDDGFRDFLRGVIDGDGSIRRWCHPTNGREQWAVKIHGASRPFLEWLGQTSLRLWSVKGKLHTLYRLSLSRNPIYQMKYGKIAAKVILARAY